MTCPTGPVAAADSAAGSAQLRRGFALEYLTLAWNVIRIVVLAILAAAARSVHGFRPRLIQKRYRWAPGTVSCSDAPALASIDFASL
jgi:hypothetical protein